MAISRLTANPRKKEVLKKFNELITSKFESKFYDIIVWRTALMLSIKSSISENELKEQYNQEGIGHSGHIEQPVINFETEEIKYILINLLSLVHNKKIDIKDEFPELLKLHCRHGFDILKNELEDMGINDNIIDFFISQMEKPKEIKNSNEDREDLIIKNIQDTFGEIKAPLKFIEKKHFDRVKKLYFNIQDITYVTSNKLYGKNIIMQLETATGLRDKLYIQPTKKERIITLNIKKDNTPIFITNYKDEMNNKDLSLIIGMDDEDNIQKADLKELPHLLVAGTTGSGKTVFLHSLIYQLLDKNIELYLIDGKNGYEFKNYKNDVKVIIESEDIIPTLKNIIKDMEYRYEYSYLDDSKAIIVIIDEFVDLIMQNKIVEDLFVRLAQKGRGANIHLILATQRPDSKVMKGVLRSNIPSRVAFKVQKSTESKIILDEIGAENLFGKGDMLFSDGKEIKRLQGFLIE